MPETKRWHRDVLAIAAMALLVSPADAAPSTGLAAWQAAVQKARSSGGKALPAEDAAGAVDGVTKGGFAFHTNQDASPWWQVDLGQIEALGSVQIYGPHCPARLNRFQVRLSDDGQTWQTAYQQKGKTGGKGTFTVALDGKKGRFVRVQVPVRTWMHLAEVEVFGTADPKKNLALRRPAMQSSVSQWSSRSIRLKGDSDAWHADLEAGKRAMDSVARGAGPQANDIRKEAQKLATEKVRLDDEAWIALYGRAIEHGEKWRDVNTQWALIDLDALGRALEHLASCFPESYPDAAELRAQLAKFREQFAQVKEGVGRGDAESWQLAATMVAFQRKVLLANPLLDFDRLLLVRRKASNLGLPANWQSNCVLRKTGYDNDVAMLSPVTPAGEIATVYKPAGDTFVGDVELHPDANRLMFSKSNPKKPWQVYEMDIDPATGGIRPELRQVTPGQDADVNNYDACYLPNGDVLYCSTAPMVAVPCVNGSTPVANIFRLSRDGTTVRQLCFDQEHAWCPTMLDNGRVLYLRWEYADLPHSNSRILFHMNPDGTAQMEYYGSNSYWPNGVFYARPIPGLPSQSVGIVTGHHGVRRMGELVIFDRSKGQRESDGVVQRIPGYGKPVEPIVRDALVNGSWPKFLHPFPLGRPDGKGSGKYFLASMQPDAKSLWGIYLVDVFDNLLLLKECPGYALLEPVPLKKRAKPRVIPDKVDLRRRDALVYLSDIHRGPGLRGIPLGEVKALRLFTYTYGYRGMGGLYGTIGIDGPWDMRRVLGTVPVESDGSAFFRVPANVPIAVQPLDSEGKAMQIMRSWFTAMPGEVLSCVGCHEEQTEVPPTKRTVAALKPPVDVVSWYGQARGFAFPEQVQPILDRECIGCHNGVTKLGDQPLFSLRGDDLPKKWASKMPGHAGKWGGKFSIGYVNLHRYVRHPGIESDMHLVNPMDFHADTTELVQILRKGHQGVKLTREEWDRIVTWIDMNTPYHGDWSTIAGPAACDREKRRADMRKLYACVDEYHINTPAEAATEAAKPLAEVARPDPPPLPTLPGWPWAAADARRRQTRPKETLELGPATTMAFVYVPPGEFVMGSADGCADERPARITRIERGFWMSQTEVTNEQFTQFSPGHNSRREHKQGYQFGVKGYPLNTPRQPVVRVSWQQARGFCAWLRTETGLRADLPTEAQWEYACRAGTHTPCSYGDLTTDFSSHANVADAKTSELASNPYTPATPIKDPPEFDDWLPKDARFNDGSLVSVDVGKYQPNVWGLHDMHGNVAEWTRSLYQPYPCDEADGRNAPSAEGQRVVRGGSWRDRPKRCTSSYRLAYRAYQQVFNVGFRVIIDEDLKALRTQRVARRRSALEQTTPDDSAHIAPTQRPGSGPRSSRPGMD